MTDVAHNVLVRLPREEGYQESQRGYIQDNLTLPYEVAGKGAW